MKADLDEAEADAFDYLGSRLDGASEEELCRLFGEFLIGFYDDPVNDVSLGR